MSEWKQPKDFVVASVQGHASNLNEIGHLRDVIREIRQLCLLEPGTREQYDCRTHGERWAMIQSICAREIRRWDE